MHSEQSCEGEHVYDCEDLAGIRRGGSEEGPRIHPRKHARLSKRKGKRHGKRDSSR